MINFAKMKHKDRKMNKNKNIHEEMIGNVEDEKSEIIEETIEEIENEASKIAEEVIKPVEEITSEIAEEVEDETSKMTEEAENESSETVEESVEDFPLPEKIKKHIKAIHLVEKAKKIVKEANERTEACKLLLESNLKKYADAKSELRAGGLDECEALVKKLDYQTKDDEPSDETAVVFEPKEDVKPLVVKDVSSGKFTGFIYALLGGVATAVGLVYLATEKLDMTLNVTKVPSEDIVQSILAWFSTTIGVREDVYMGAGVFVLAVLSVMIFIYVALVSLKASSNLHFAVKQFVEAELYTGKKANCKAEADKVDAHIKDTINTLKTYEVLFNEQQGKLQRILYIEGEKEKSTDYHEKSHLEIRETKELISTIRDFINIPMLEEGKLSSKSVPALQNIKFQIDKILERLY